MLLFAASEKVRDMESLKEAKSVLECFSILQYENVFSKRNVIFLQFLLKLTECDELNEMCINYALNQEALCYFDNSSTLLGMYFFFYKYFSLRTQYQSKLNFVLLFMSVTTIRNSCTIFNNIFSIFS